MADAPSTVVGTLMARIGNPWKNTQLEALGAFLRAERKLAHLTLRELASLTDLSNAYLSQVERGLHEPSVRVLRSISDALGVSTTTVLARAGLIDEEDVAPTPQAIAADPLLSAEQKEALLSVYRSYVAGRKNVAEPKEKAEPKKKAG